MSMTETPKRRIDVNRIAFDVVLLAFFTIIVIASLGLRPGAQLVPLLVGVPGLIGCIVQLVIDLVRGPRASAAAVEAAPGGETGSTDMADVSIDRLVEATKVADATEELESIGHGTPFRRQFAFIIWAVGFVVVSIVLTEYLPAPPGLRTWYLPVTLVALIAVFRYIRLGWWKTLAISVPLVAGLYGLLVVLLQVRI